MVAAPMANTTLVSAAGPAGRLPGPKVRACLAHCIIPGPGPAVRPPHTHPPCTPPPTLHPVSGSRASRSACRSRRRRSSTSFAGCARPTPHPLPPPDRTAALLHALHLIACLAQYEEFKESKFKWRSIVEKYPFHPTRSSVDIKARAPPLSCSRTPLASSRARPTRPTHKHTACAHISPSARTRPRMRGWRRAQDKWRNICKKRALTGAARQTLSGVMREVLPGHPALGPDGLLATAAGEEAMPEVTATFANSAPKPPPVSAQAQRGLAPRPARVTRRHQPHRAPTRHRAGHRPRHRHRKTFLRRLPSFPAAFSRARARSSPYPQPHTPCSRRGTGGDVATSAA